MPGNINHQAFMSLLTQLFPEVVVDIDDCSQGLLHCEMGTLGRATQRAIDAREAATVRRHFQFVDEILRNAASDVENAVYVSYLENLKFESGQFDARKLLSTRLQQALAELEAP